ncbi:uncharacterized protein DUF4136 [Gillisia mitskevichiae]|uniref:Uncharacterized protein DUF4136 n=1 Tax=Gillisia mitskevichiae TaxID=270921 RepID=A0A495P367_9FLAO|nr:DUF4136 domain-containing protein [Gillisia mitskevichiae]RKS44933.1 uncharacterized protein DUF4136 [Gillisia mitskevichiae]
MENLKYLLLLLIVTACNAPRATYDYDQNMEFNSITSYKIYPDLRSNLSQLDEQRMLGILDSEMNKVGLTASESTDIYLNFYSTSYEEPSRNNIGIGVGGSGRNVGVGVSGGIPLGGSNTYLRVTFDFINVKTDALIWQAIVESPFNRNGSPMERENQLRVMVQKALKGYPPNEK